MKARWLLITLLLAFPFAFAFFLSEARLGEKRKAKPALVVSPASARAGSVANIENVSTTPTGSPAEASSSAPASGGTSTTVKSPDAKPALLEGNFTKEDGSFIYDADAKLRLSKDVILSSPTGVMVSDEKQTVFAGDMQIESGKNIITAHEGVLDIKANQMKATVASVSFTNANNQLIRMTGENVTLEIPPAQPSGPQKIVAESITMDTPLPTSVDSPSPVK